MLKNPRFLSPEIPSIGKTLILDEKESAHCCRVLRMSMGDKISVIDGKGTLAQASILEAHPRKTKVEIQSLSFTERLSKVSIAFGLVKPQSLELIFKKCTELGIRSFQPLITDHSLHPESWNSERWQSIVEEACKQCQELWFPEMKQPLSLKTWCSNRLKDSNLVLCDELLRKPKLTSFSSISTDVLVGPEGGWSDAERELFETLPIRKLGLGVNRLRSETACIVAVTLVKSYIGEL
jgi:16S rRNA (uracil1498-N3)-methyltransferase